MERLGALCVAQLAKTRTGRSEAVRGAIPRALLTHTHVTTRHFCKKWLLSLPPPLPSRYVPEQLRRVRRRDGRDVVSARGSIGKRAFAREEALSARGPTSRKSRLTLSIVRVTPPRNARADDTPLSTLSPQAEFRGQTAGLKRVQPVKVRAPSRFYPWRCREYLVTARGFPGLRARVRCAATVH